MIRIAIIAIIGVVGAIMFLPQTVAMFPSLDNVIGTATTDLGSLRDSVIDNVRDTATNAIDSVSNSISDVLSS